MEESTATGVRRAKQRNSRTEDRCRGALTSPRRLSAHPPGQAGAGSWGSGFGRIAGRGLGLAAWTEPEGVSAPQLAGREPGKRSGAAEKARDFFLPLGFLVREESGFRVLPKRAPEMGARCGYQRGPQRWAWNAKAAAAATKKPVCKHRSLSTPPLPGACAARHCQGSMIQGQLPQKNARSTSGCCYVMPASATAGSLRNRTLPSPRPEWARAPEAAAPLTPSCVSKEQTPSGDQHAEAGPNPKLKHGSCANKEEKGKFLPAASEAAD